MKYRSQRIKTWYAAVSTKGKSNSNIYCSIKRLVLNNLLSMVYSECGLLKNESQ